MRKEEFINQQMPVQQWNKSLFISDSTGAIDIIMDPTNPDRMMAAMWERVRRPNASHLYGPSSGIYKTSDGGNNWQLIPSSAGLPNPNTQNVGRIGLAISQSNPDIVYALYTDGTDIISLFKSTNFGNNWIDVDPDNEFRMVHQRIQLVFWTGKSSSDKSRHCLRYGCCIYEISKFGKYLVN